MRDPVATASAPVPTVAHQQPQTKTRISREQLPRHLTLAQAYDQLYPQGLALLIDREGLFVVRTH